MEGGVRYTDEAGGIQAQGASWPCEQDSESTKLAKEGLMEKMELERQLWMALNARLNVHGKTMAMGKAVEVKGEEGKCRGRSQVKGKFWESRSHIDPSGKRNLSWFFGSFQHKSKYS